MIAAVVAYFDRPIAIRRLMSEAAENKEILYSVAHYGALGDIEIPSNVIVTPCSSKSFGHLRNQAAKAAVSAGADYLVKQDVDCTCTCYDRIPAAVDKLELVNIGVSNAGNPCIFGNEYAMAASTWADVGGEPEWDGYGWEDYAFIARWMVATGLVDVLARHMQKATIDDCTFIFRERIARPMNRLHDLSMVHHPHPINTDGAKENKVLFYKLITELIGG